MAPNADAIRAVLAAGHPDTAVVGVTMGWLRAVAPLIGVPLPDQAPPITGTILDVSGAIAAPGAPA